MVHKSQYQRLADAMAINRGGFASHIGKIGEDTFVYSLLTANSADYNPDSPTVITVSDQNQSDASVNIYEGEATRAILVQTTMREFSTGRAIFKKYQVLVKNKSAMIGDAPAYAQMIVDAVASKAIKTSLLYQYLEVAEHYHKKLSITGSNLTLQ